MVDLPVVVRVIAVQTGFAGIGRVGVGQPERTAGSNRVRVAGRAQEPVPGLAAADRAHRITPGPGREGVLAPCAQPGHVRPPIPPGGLTATVTATAATNGERQRPATAPHTRTFHGTWGCVRPEKQTVEDQRHSAATVAKPLNNTRRTRTTLESRPSPRPVTDGPGRLAHSYGSEGWGFESLRARPGQSPFRVRKGLFC